MEEETFSGVAVSWSFGLGHPTEDLDLVLQVANEGLHVRVLLKEDQAPLVKSPRQEVVIDISIEGTQVAFCSTTRA